jgi:NADH-quinone oxidoreductase subunit G
VGALTEKDFRFAARVWYLSSAPTVCNGCSRGCNIDLHFVLDRPHLNDGARLVRIKPRYNPDVNQWWLCDEGRYGFGWVDRARLTKVRGPETNGDGRRDRGHTWEQALTAISGTLAELGQRHHGNGAGAGIGVIASAQLTNEELFLIREVLEGQLGARVSASVGEQAGFADDFLINGDKNPNTRGVTLLGIGGPGAPDAAQIVDDAVAGNLGALWVFGHDLVELFGEEKVQELSRKVELFVFSGTNHNATVPFAHWVLPSAAYVEKDGTFVNCHGRVQRIGRAFPPLADSREEWRILLDLAERMGRPLDWRQPKEIFLQIAESVAPFDGLSYESIGEQGAETAMGAGPAPEVTEP